MPVRIVEGQKPYTAGPGIDIDANKVISLLLREENNLIYINDNDEAYVDLQLQSGLTPNSDFPVGVTVGKVLQADGWTKSGLVLNRKTTSGDYARWIYATDGELYFDKGTGVRNQVYYSSEVDALLAELDSKIDAVADSIGDGQLTIQKNSTTVGTFTANQSGDTVVDIEVPSVIDNLTSTDTDNALSAYQGRVLKDMISSATGGLGRFLSLWNSSTGMPISFPLSIPYTYGTGDWFLVEVTGTTNYMPTGSSYTGTASTVVDTNTVEKGDVYIYDGNEWLLQKNTAVEVSFSNITGQPSDNTALASALNAKANDSAVVKLTGNQTVAGVKTFNSSPSVPTPTNNSDAATKKYVDDTASSSASGKVSDTAYASSWNGVTTIAPSKNAVYDKISAMDTTIAGKQATLSAGTGIDITSNTVSTLNNFGTSSTAAATVQKEVSIPGIKTLNVGQVVYILPSTTSTVASSTLKVNNFTAYPMRYNNANITTSTGSIVRPANIITSFVFDGTYWQFLGHGLDSNTTYSNMSATEANTGTATSARTISASVLKGAVEAHAPVKSVNGQTGAVTVNDIKSSATAPSSPTEGMVWYDTTNDQLKVYDGTNWNVTGKEYTAGPGIAIGTYNDYSAMQGPCDSGFHIPTKDERQALKDEGITLGAWTSSGGTNFKNYLKLPFNGYSGNDGGVYQQGYEGHYWACQCRGTGTTYANGISIKSSVINVTVNDGFCNGNSIRPIKDVSIIPDSSWTTLYQGTGSAGIFRNPSLGLISLSSDGTTWITIQDKNLGATTVYNDGDTLSEANCGKYYQRGNNYGFPRTGSVTTSSTKVDASNYGPGNYYSSSTFITGTGNWSSVSNANLRGGVTGVVTINDAITNTGVTSVNGQTGNVVLSAGDVLVSDQANNILTSGMKIWAGTQANYEALSSYDSNCVYLTIE